MYQYSSKILTALKNTSFYTVLYLRSFEKSNTHKTTVALRDSQLSIKVQSFKHNQIQLKKDALLKRFSSYKRERNISVFKMLFSVMAIQYRLLKLFQTCLKA